MSSLASAESGLCLSSTNDQGQLVLSWPAWVTDGVLEETTNLQPPVTWVSVSPQLYETEVSTLNFLYRAVTDSTEEQCRFYRVHRVVQPVPGLSGYWQLDEGTGQVAADSSGVGTSLFATNTEWAVGRIGSGSLRFNGQPIEQGGSLAWINNDNYQVLPPPGQPFSFSLWFSPDALPIGSWTIAENDSGQSQGWHLALITPASGTNYLVLSGAGLQTSLSVTGQTLLLPQQWHQLVITSDTNQTSVFLDNRLFAETPGGLMNNDGPLWLGGAPDGENGFPGRLDEIRVYTNSFSPERVSLTGEWHFDENAGYLAADSSSQGHYARVITPKAWATGKSGSGIDLSIGPVVIPNEDFSVLPPSGGAFGVSLWIYPNSLASGSSGLLSCAGNGSRGWQVTLEVQDSGLTLLAFTSTNLGGTLSLQVPVTLTNQTWTKVDLEYEGGMAAIYVNGNAVGSELGAIEGANAPLILGQVPGTASFNGVVDDLRTYGRDRAASEIGPVAVPMWEMVLLNSTTNFLLQGSGPAGKPLTFSVLSTPGPMLGTIMYSPYAPLLSYVGGSEKGPDLFAYTVSDGEFVSPPATVSVSVVEPHWLSINGGSASLLDGSTSDAAWAAGSAEALDAIWKTNNYYDCFIYGPGEYQTTGWKLGERRTAFPGCKHIGAGLEGAESTTIKLVNAGSGLEGVIFADLYDPLYSDGFEVHNMVLDCNAENNPKYALGEPVILRIPLTSTATVDTVTLHWSSIPIYINSPLNIGPPAEFSLCTRTSTTNGYATNCQAFTSTGQVDVVSVQSQTDELQLMLTRRADGVDFYGLGEMEISGATVSLPTAVSSGGGESLLDGSHSILMATDNDLGTYWASGPEETVQITLPLEPGSSVSQVNFNWNCLTLSNLMRLGPAAQYAIFSRDESTGQFINVPFVSQARTAGGLEIVTFGSDESTNAIVTDQLMIVLVGRDPGVDYYSLQEVSLQNSSTVLALRVPTASSTLVWNGTHSVLRAFDNDTNTDWACGTQGSITAVDARGSNLKFTKLKVIDFGTKAGAECFPMTLSAPAPSINQSEPLSNVLIEDCLFTQPATNNSDGVSVVTVVGSGPDSLRNAIVRRCKVSGVRSKFAYSHGFGATRLENCVVDDCQVAVYFEPDTSGAGFDSVGPVLLRSNRFENVDQGIYLFFHPDAHFDSLFCLDNDIALTPGGTGFGISACDVCVPGPSGTITNLLALNNIIRNPGWVAHPDGFQGALAYTDIHHAVYGNNVVALGTSGSLRVRSYPAGSIPGTTTPPSCDHPGLILQGSSTYPDSLDKLPPGYRRAWYNNRDLSGLLLPVLFLDSGVDGLASQQQWGK